MAMHGHATARSSVVSNATVPNAMNSERNTEQHQELHMLSIGDQLDRILHKGANADNTDLTATR